MRRVLQTLTLIFNQKDMSDTWSSAASSGAGECPRCCAERATGEEEERSAREGKESLGGPCKFSTTFLQSSHTGRAPIIPRRSRLSFFRLVLPLGLTPVAALHPSSLFSSTKIKPYTGFCVLYKACSPDEVCYGSRKRSSSSICIIYLRRSTSSPAQSLSAGPCRQSSSPAGGQTPGQLSHIHDCCPEECWSSQYSFNLHLSHTTAWIQCSVLPISHFVFGR